MNLGKDLIEIIVAAKASKYDDVNDELKANFENVDLESVGSIKFSANSYGVDACQWIQ